MTAAPKIVPIAPGIWAAEMEDIGSRSLIVEFADHLAVLEFAVGSKNGERLADAARARWPGKPIRYDLSVVTHSGTRRSCGPWPHDPSRSSPTGWPAPRGR